MSVYSHVIRRGPIRSKMSRAHILRTAARFNSLRMPVSANSIFARLKFIQDRRGITMPTPPILATPQPLLMTPGTTYTRATDGEKAAITGGTPLVRNMINPTGIAAPAQYAGLAVDPTVPNPRYQYVSDFRTEWIDDRNWGTNATLPEIIGSGMLAPFQLRQASINNILSLFDFQGGTEQERLEMGYIFQRFVIEGMIRGVNVLTHLIGDNNTAGRKLIIKLGTTEDMTFTDSAGVQKVAAGLSYGDQYDGPNSNWPADQANRVLFLDTFWRDSSDQTKLSVFAHEFGHQLVSWADSDYYYGIKNPADASPSGFNDYFGHLFAEGPRGSGKDYTFKEMANQQYVPLENLWGMPQVGGGDVGDPNEPAIPEQNPPSPPPPDTNTTTPTGPVGNVTTTPVQVVPYSGQPAQIGSGNMTAPTPESIDKTPVAGMLPQLPGLFSFQAGLQDTLRRNTKMLNGLAGSLLAKGA